MCEEHRAGNAIGRMMVRSIFLLALFCPTSGSQQSAGEGPADPESAAFAGRLTIARDYREAKDWLFEEVVAGRRETLYCCCAFDRSKRPDLASCGYVPLRPGSERAQRVEVEHVIPASWIGGDRPCWRQAICTDGAGRRFKGRACCEAVDTNYNRAANDLQNLWPTIGEVNGERQNYRFGIIPGEVRAFGRCDFEIDREGRVVEPRPEVRGDIARIGLYMELVHGVRLSAHHRALFSAWNRADPPDAAEQERNARIRRLQGLGNPFVENYAERLVRLPAPAGDDAVVN